MMELIQIKDTDKLYQQALDLRYELFFKQPNLPREILFDSLENNSVHIAVACEDNLYAYGRLSEGRPNQFKISQMVVRPDMQGQGLGTQVLTKLTDIARERKAKQIYLNARLHAIKMYENLGFKISGDAFVAQSTGVPHIKMVRDY
ncbi:GNAT family N-acetyltransferase [Vibrio rhodolitus]|uniref:GNAT family N-acetyltransferase n=1 Tax=Vibrio rhodolitus TaxID=2231649 RepID=UPI001FC92D16|nr:GNAT family N-acetyltransferase [Vibrio rhodolitus]